VIKIRAVILSAGKATRLLPMSAFFPKAFLNVGEFSIIEHQLKALYDNRIYDIDIVVGHLAFMFEKRIKEFVKYPMSVRLINNPNYCDTNTLYSLQLALEKDASTTLVLNGDVYCNSKHIEKFICAGNYVGIDKIRSPESIFSGEEVVVRFNDCHSNGMGYRISKIGKSTKGRAEAVGIYRIESEFAEHILLHMSNMDKQLYYEDAMNKILQFYDVFSKEIPGTIEIDTEDDLKRINQLYLKENK